MPQNITQTLASDTWTDVLIEAYRTPEGKAAQALDRLIDRLERKSLELNQKMDKKNILLRDAIDGELKTCKILKERCIDAARKRAEKDKREKKALKDARLAAGYHLATVKMFHELSDNDLMSQITGFSGKDVFKDEFRRIYHDYLEDMKEAMEEHFVRFKEFAKEQGIEIKDETVKTDVGEFEVWDFLEDKKPKKKHADLDDMFADELPKTFKEFTAGIGPKKS